MAAKIYSDKFKLEVLEYLKENKYSYYQTAKLFKISINTIKAWDPDYPHNLPEKVQLRMQLNRLKRTKRWKPEIIHSPESTIKIEQLPENIDELQLLAVKHALSKGIFLLDYTNQPREYLDVVRALGELIKLPANIKTAKKKSAVETLIELYQTKSKA